MKHKILIFVMMVIMMNVSPIYGTMTLMLDDGVGHSQIITDEGVGDRYSLPGVILWMGSIPGSVWSGNITVGLSKPLVGSQFNPQMDLSIQQAYSSGAGTLTITLMDIDFGPLSSDTGIITLAMGGANNQKNISAYGLINDSVVVSTDVITGIPWSTTSKGIANGLDSVFSLTEKVVIVHSSSGYTMGDISLDVVAIPEASTYIAGLLLLIPTGILMIKKHKLV